MLCGQAEIGPGRGRGSLKRVSHQPRSPTACSQDSSSAYCIFLIKESREQFTVSLLCSFKLLMRNIRYERVCSNRIDRCAIPGYLVTSGLISEVFVFQLFLNLLHFSSTFNYFKYSF